MGGSLDPSESSTQTASVSVESFFAGLTSVTDPTDRPRDRAARSVTIDRVYVNSTGDAA